MICFDPRPNNHPRFPTRSNQIGRQLIILFGYLMFILKDFPEVYTEILQNKKEEEKISLFPFYVVTRIASFLCNVSNLDPHVIDRTSSPVSWKYRVVGPNPFSVISASDNHAKLQWSGWCLTRAPDWTVISCHEPPIRRTNLFQKKNVFNTELIVILRD